ncbi:response regulator [Halosegnis rubeus]|uniref:Response regulator n=1 Tax=Halosegnis rubeus TaxID=2212850 RepID=A0A5N5U384_9EURY|nr:response regulator [Halosegnis rubeus]KAB7513030.1 response regulator [Halosegnis rubeus]KAB7513112.1 response regulator [Halosegnis rubeus]KAB7516602.1 response regulator [Halosegnis rubeus]
MTHSSTVLIVEDEENLADLFGIWLQEQFEVHVAYSGEDALEIFAEESIDIVLLDRRMPGLSGTEVLQSIRESGDAQQVIMLTAVQPTEDLASIDVDDYLLKPIDRTKLLRAVEAAELVLTYEDSLTGLLSLTARKATLGANLDKTELEQDERYGALIQRIRELKEEADTTLQRLETDYQIDMLVRDQRIGSEPVEQF